MAVFCGIDWAEDHHDIALVDQDGTLLAKRRIGDDAAGFAALLQLLAEAGDSPDGPIPVAIETSRGLLVAEPARHRTSGVPDQPDVGIPLPRPALGRAAQVRRRRRAGAGQHPAHRPGRAPSAARRLRAGSGDRGVGPRATGRGLGAHRRAQQAALTAARVLPRPPPGLRAQARRAAAPRSPRPAGHRPHPPRCRPADRGPATGAAAPRRASARHRRRSRTTPAGAARRLPAPPEPGGGGLRATGPGPAAPARHRVRQRRRPRGRHRATLRRASGRGHHHQHARARRS